jgi:DNA-binding NarL/FixJ family response regulator
MNRDMFTNRQKEIISFIRDGLSNKEIGEKLGLSVKTIENTIRYCLLKSRTFNRTHLAICALRLGEIDLYGENDIHDDETIKR